MDRKKPESESYLDDSVIVLLLWSENQMEQNQGIQHLLSKHGDKVLSVLRAKFRDSLDWDEIQDVFSEALLIVWKKRDTFDEQCALLPWFMKIARNCALQRLRRRKITSVELPNDLESDDPLPEESDHLEFAATILDEVYRIIETDLSELQRCIVLADLETNDVVNTTKALAIQWNRPASSIRTERARAHNKIEQILAKNGYRERI